MHKCTLYVRGCSIAGSHITIGFEKATPLQLMKEILFSATVLNKLNNYRGVEDVGCLDLAENHFVGIKSHSIYNHGLNYF
ncbi:argininosuccinate synthase domain-containing protein [Bartonella australis]|uniref:argininosuccinate synthase domain-containing protein n=1 Tax=Bartonella australis TaxID=388640 RepID=UPI000344F671